MVLGQFCMPVRQKMRIMKLNAEASISAQSTVLKIQIESSNEDPKFRWVEQIVLGIKNVLLIFEWALTSPCFTWLSIPGSACQSLIH